MKLEIVNLKKIEKAYQKACKDEKQAINDRGLAIWQNSGR
ncbi:hypothetical protein C900_03357 [Fulvivirga imtechensis AK7]|uniref:Uncharacterized protein n=1 Tax=Fulvivirga imtechensis AK7 TaxID=1237149 RepID=L8JTD7_9BACT|nr:hypothetical protein C900_03357 [Fulvivirga imtechensis AK7]